MITRNSLAPPNLQSSHFRRGIFLIDPYLKPVFVPHSDYQAYLLLRMTNPEMGITEWVNELKRTPINAILSVLPHIAPEKDAQSQQKLDFSPLSK